MHESIQPDDYIRQFARLAIGEVMKIPVSTLTTNQPDDHIPSVGYGPIEACFDAENVLVIHGHHRVYDFLRAGGNPNIDVRKIANPYL